MVSILNNDDHPSFAIRSNIRLAQNASSPVCCFRPEQQLPTVSHSQHTHPHTSANEAASHRGTGRLSAQFESMQPISPCPSDGSSQDYISYQPTSSSADHPYSHQQPQREAYQYLSSSPAAPRTPAETHTTPAAKSSPGKSAGPGHKNKYPCPYAGSHGCSATFTTSGHAARHGKKHTGEKGVHCPICNKAFTRKDNMNQHIRTHRTHSDDLRSTSEAEGELCLGVDRRDLH